MVDYNTPIKWPVARLSYKVSHDIKNPNSIGAIYIQSSRFSQ